jgi:hypothetical protein
VSDTTTSLLWPDPRKGPWTITLRWAAINARAEVVAAEVTGDRPLTTEVMRSVPWASLINAERVTDRRVAKLVPTPKARAGEDRSAKVARVHRAARKRGEPAVAAVASRLGVSRRTASRYVAAARDAGLIDKKES